VVTGGVARPQSYELAGPLATHILEGVSLDLAILGVDAVDPMYGASAHHEGEADINKLMASRARQVVVVADSSKLGAQAFARIRRPEEIDLLITDVGVPDDAVAKFEEAGVKVMCV
jgi:DeoR family transcriptional regulator of aga operon